MGKIRELVAIAFGQDILDVRNDQGDVDHHRLADYEKAFFEVAHLVGEAGHAVAALESSARLARLDTIWREFLAKKSMTNPKPKRVVDLGWVPAS